MKTQQTNFKETEIGLIPEEWDVSELGKFAELVKEGYLPNGHDNLPYVGLEHIDQQTLSLNSIGKSSDVTSNKFRFLSGDILFGKLRPYFRKVYRPNFSGICSTDIWVARAKEGFDQGWLFYLFASEDFVNSASGGSGGTRMPRADWNHLKDTIWPVPRLPEQHRIASILSSLDDKIELNRQINANLEKMASALFKRWFVDFEFPNEEGKPYKSSGGKMVETEMGEVPEGWRAARLVEFFPVTTGKKDANAAVDSGQYPFFTCSQNSLLTDQFCFDSSSILLTGNGDFNVKWYEGKFDAYQRTYVLTPYQKYYLGFLFYAIKHFLNDITAGHRGSVIRFITKGMIENFQIAIPDESKLIKMAPIFYEINQVIDHCRLETKTLTDIRDSLLPRLMGGKIRVIV